MDPTIVALTVALVGAISGLVGGYLAGRRQSQLEYNKWIRTREDDLAKEARLAVADLTRKLATATHGIVWLAWKAVNRPNDVTQQDISAYDDEMHKLIPDIVGALAVVSALNKDLYYKMNPLVSQFYELDGQLAFYIPSFRDSSKLQVDEIRKIYERAYILNRELTQKVTEVFVEIYQNPISDYVSESNTRR